MWHGFIDQFAKDNPKEFKEEENKLHEETTALVFLANSNKQKYGHIIAELHDDYLMGNNHYPSDVNAMYKLLDEHSNDKKAIDPSAAEAPHLAFAQAVTGKVQDNRQFKCHRCGLANYTIYTCPNCNNKNKFNNGRSQINNGGKQDNFQRIGKHLHRLVKVKGLRVL